jgi:hypothetical protein
LKPVTPFSAATDAQAAPRVSFDTGPAASSTATSTTTTQTAPAQ